MPGRCARSLYYFGVTTEDRNGYRWNHYVPEWLQKRFLFPGENTLCYLDLDPPVHRDGRGKLHRVPGLRHLAPSRCFAVSDLYTEFIGDVPRTEIERLFFGKVDDRGKAAVEAFSNYSVGGSLDHHEAMLEYMGTQRFRTPRGLAWLAARAGRNDHSTLLDLMIGNRAMYFAIWSESVWQVVDATDSPTKFILSDSPVTLYNRHFGPRSDSCRGANDPDLRAAATHTIFPLDLEHLLVLTHLTWARNPYQNPGSFRPNPRLNRLGVFKAMDVQTGRSMAEAEVREVNFIIKSRSMRYLAAGKEEWLYPEQFVSKSNWSTFGDGYLLMPDPRLLSTGGTVYAMGRYGGFAADEYGRGPTHPDFESSESERVALYRFQGEFARLHGRKRRGRTRLTATGLSLAEDTDELHSYYLGQEERYKRAMRGSKRY